jgi:ferredoxin-NADP reductase
MRQRIGSVVSTSTAPARPPALPPVWNCEDDDRLVCRKIVAETHDVKTFIFTAPAPRLFQFAPGQFLTFEFPVGAEPIHRCYTIASSPTRPYAVSITVKRTVGGPVSNWLHDHLRVGDTVRAVGPMGEFSTERHPARKRLFLSGGSGITPLMSMLRHDHDAGEDHDTVFVHCARTPKDIVFRHELDLIARRESHLRVVHLVEGPGEETSWSGYRGRISREFLELAAPDFRDREVFCCGPGPFMAAVRHILHEAGYDMARYHEESFVFEDLARAEGLPPADLQPEPSAARVHSIAFGKMGRTIACDENTTILSAARAAGLRLPSSCTKGLCGTCKTKKLSGEVEMTHSGGIRQREIDQGFVLLCCSKPRGDVVVDR